MQTMKPLRTKRELDAAYKQFAKALKNGADGPCRRNVGWQGGNMDSSRVFYRERDGIWVLLDDTASDSQERHWCAFGTNLPEEKTLNIVCEINPPTSGVYRRTAGVFLRDSRKRVYIAHSGKVGGGKKGVGKSAFLRKYTGRRVLVDWGDGDTSSALLLSALSDRKLPAHVAAFVRQVEQFKGRITKREKPTSGEKRTARFTPEFSESYTSRVKWTGRTKRLHGKIVNALAARMAKMGYRVFNDTPRDLFVAGKGSAKKILFEAKTGAGSTDIYTGVGQLLVNGSLKPAANKLVLVLPRDPRSQTHDILNSLGLLVLLFSVKRGEVKFGNLAEVLDERSRGQTRRR